MVDYVGKSNPSSFLGYEIIQPKLDWDAEEFLSSADPSVVSWASLCRTNDEDSLTYRLFLRLTEIVPNIQQRDYYVRRVQLLTNKTSLQFYVTKYMNIFQIKSTPPKMSIIKKEEVSVKKKAEQKVEKKANSTLLLS